MERQVIWLDTDQAAQLKEQLAGGVEAVGLDQNEDRTLAVIEKPSGQYEVCLVPEED